MKGRWAMRLCIWLREYVRTKFFKQKSVDFICRDSKSKSRSFNFVCLKVKLASVYPVWLSLDSNQHGHMPDSFVRQVCIDLT